MKSIENKKVSNRIIPIRGGKQNGLDELQSRVVDWLRFPLIVLVAYIHYYGPEIQPKDDIGTDIYKYLMILMSHVITRSAVPTFFLISGFYFFSKSDFNMDVYKKKILSRIRTIVVPYILWITTFILLTVGIKLAGCLIKGNSFDGILMFFNDNGWLNIYWNCNEWAGRYDWAGYLHYNTSPILTHLWYLRDLCIMFIISPILYMCIRKFGMWFISILFFCDTSGFMPQIPGGSCGILYFSIGAYLAINNKNIVEVTQKYKNTAYISTIALLPLMTFYDGRYTDVGNILYPFWVFVLMVSYINIAATIVSRGWLRQPASMPKSSFFIYCLHAMFVMGYCGRFMMKVIPSDNWFLASVRYMLVPLLCVAICYAIYIIMNRYTPKLLAVLTGNRN